MNERAITGDEEGEEKNPYRLYFFHLNCKHLFGCKANRTFISILRFGLIMSTPTFRGVGRCWGCGGFAGCAQWGLASWSRQESIDHTCRGARGPLGTTECVLRGGWGTKTQQSLRYCSLETTTRLCSAPHVWGNKRLSALGFSLGRNTNNG